MAATKSNCTSRNDALQYNGNNVSEQCSFGFDFRDIQGVYRWNPLQSSHNSNPGFWALRYFKSVETIWFLISCSYCKLRVKKLKQWEERWEMRHQNSLVYCSWIKLGSCSSSWFEALISMLHSRLSVKVGNWWETNHLQHKTSSQSLCVTWSVSHQAPVNHTISVHDTMCENIY